MAKRDTDNGYSELVRLRKETFAALAKKVAELIDTDEAVNHGNNMDEALRLLERLEPPEEDLPTHLLRGPVQPARALRVRQLDTELQGWLGAPSPQLGETRLRLLHQAVDRYQALMDD